MIEGLDRLLEDFGEPHLNELRGLLRELLSPCGPPARLVSQNNLRRPQVYRVQFETGAGIRSFVIKRLRLAVARRDQLIANRWLPAIGLGRHGPPLLGVAAERSGQSAWHVYEDLGDWTLHGPDLRKDAGRAQRLAAPVSHPDPERFRAAVEVIATVHARFAGHALLGECRLEGGDLGTNFFKANVSDAICVLDSLRPPAVPLPPERAALRDRLLARMRALLSQEPYRTQHLERFGGPETLVHGDLRPHNTMVIPAGDGLHVRLIDWDHAAVGHASYDLSTLLLCLPPRDRLWVLHLYEEAAAGLGWSVPPREELNLLFDTAESARLANGLIWPAISALESQADWAFDELSAFDQWFEDLKPVLPFPPTARAARDPGIPAEEKGGLL